MVHARVLTAGKAKIVENAVVKIRQLMDPIVPSSVLVTGITLICKSFSKPFRTQH